MWLQIGPRPRRWTPRPAVSDHPDRPKSGQHSAPFQRRGLGKVGFALARLILVAVTQSPADPAMTPSATRLVGTNDQRGLRCSCVRACGLALLPGATHNTYCAFAALVPRSAPLFRTAPTLLTRETLRRWNKESHNMALCDAPLRRCHADCSLTSRKVSAVSAPACRHRSRHR